MLISTGFIASYVYWAYCYKVVWRRQTGADIAFNKCLKPVFSATNYSRNYKNCSSVTKFGLLDVFLLMHCIAIDYV